MRLPCFVLFMKKIFVNLVVEDFAFEVAFYEN